MLPEKVINIISEEKSRKNSADRSRLIKKMIDQGVYSASDAMNIIDEEYISKSIQDAFQQLRVGSDNSFFDFYSSIGFPPLGLGDQLYTLDQILEDHENSFWSEEYPELTDRYLQISSIEGEGSYFYDKKTDAVYDVGWDQMGDFVRGELKPKWKTFYDFLEWYYSDQDE